ncbi:LysR substrate-binding domain-containing protein [Streptomyces sp. NPDC096040]|uniref:LysR substrate-binding domain-containing protein n=1 Tax=Streptomyces sp. NPDC096040 TaxID=3155541 RepID=UPI003319CE04
MSRQIATLEKEAGAAFPERVGRGGRPAAAELLLSEYADAVARQVAEAETALADLLVGRTGRLSVRYFATAGAALVAPAVARLRAEHPGGRIELRPASDAKEPLADVKEGRAGLAVLVRAEGRQETGVRLLRLLDDPCLTVPPRGRVARTLSGQRGLCHRPGVRHRRARGEPGAPAGARQPPSGGGRTGGPSSTRW